MRLILVCYHFPHDIIYYQIFQRLYINLNNYKSLFSIYYYFSKILFMTRYLVHPIGCTDPCGISHQRVHTLYIDVEASKSLFPIH